MGFQCYSDASPQNEGEGKDICGFEEFLLGESAKEKELMSRLNREGVHGRKLVYEQAGGEAWRR